MSLHNNISKKIIFHNIKNNFWNYFNFSLSLNQNLIFFSSEKNLFENFKVLFEKTKKYQGFITYNDQIFSPKIKVYSDFLTKDNFEKIQNNLVIDILLPMWEIQKINLNNKKHIKELSEYISLEIYNFSKNLTSYLDSLNNKVLSDEELAKKILQLKNKYKFLHKRILNFYNKKQKIWNNDISGLNILSIKTRELKNFFWKKIVNKNNFSLVYKAIMKNIVDIINTNKILLKQESNFEKKNILFLIKLYSLFLKNIWKRDEFFSYFNSSQLLYLYKQFQKWAEKLLTRLDLNNYDKIDIIFKQTFYSFFINFVQKNKQSTSNGKSIAQKPRNSHLNNGLNKEIDNKLSDYDLYYESVKSNNLRLEKANLLWHKDVIKTDFKYSNWSSLLFFESKKIIWQINQMAKTIKNNSKSTDFFVFLNHIIKDLNLFFNWFNKNKLNDFLNKTLFYEFCFKNKMNLNFLFTKVKDLTINELFAIELAKIKASNFNLLLLNSETFFFDEKLKNNFIEELSIFLKNNNSQLFLFEKKPIQFKKNFSVIFIEKGTLIEFKNNLEDQPKFNTFFANYFFNNGNFYTNELGNIKKHLFLIMGLSQIRKNGNDVFNAFEKKRLQWVSFDELSENIDLNIIEKSTKDFEVIKL